MKMVIVTLTFTANAMETSYDMEMPCQVPVHPLISHICQTIRYYSEGAVALEPQKLGLYCRRLGRLLEPGETLEDAGIWNGDQMDLK